MGLSTLSLVQFFCIIPTVSSSSFIGGSSSQHPSSQHPSTVVQQAVERAFALQGQGSHSDVFTDQQASLAPGLPIGPPPGLPSPPPGWFESAGSLSGPPLHAVPCLPVSKLRSSGVEESFPSADHVGRCSPVLSAPYPTGSEPRLPASRLSPATGYMDDRHYFGSQNDDARSRTDGRFPGPGPQYRYSESQNPAARGGIEEAGPREPAFRYRPCEDNSGLFVRTTDGRLCEPTREDDGGWKMIPVEQRSTIAPLPAGRLDRTAQHEAVGGFVGTGGTGPAPREAHARHPRDMSGTQEHVTCLGRPRDMSEQAYARSRLPVLSERLQRHEQAYARAAEVHDTWGGAGERLRRLVAAAQAAQQEQVRPHQEQVPQDVLQQEPQQVPEEVQQQLQVQQQQQLLNDELWQEHRQLLAQRQEQRQLLAHLQQAGGAGTTGTGHGVVGAGPAGAVCGVLLAVTGGDTCSAAGRTWVLRVAPAETLLREESADHRVHQFCGEALLMSQFHNPRSGGR